VFKEMYELLEGFSNKKIIMTNAAKGEAFQKYGLDKAPYEVFTLEHNPEKTNPEYFKKMLEYFRLGVEDVVYFEHNEDAVKSAQSVGIVAYHYDSDRKDLGALKKFLDDSLVV